METILLIIAIVLLIGVIVLAVILLLKKNKIDSVNGVDEKSLELLRERLEGSTFKNIQELKSYLLENEKTNNEKINSVESNMKDWVANQNKGTQELLVQSETNLRNRLDQAVSNSEPIGEMRDKVSKLDVLLSQNNKAGKAGEYLLERLLENISGSSQNNNLLFERQHKMIKKMPDGKELIVDLFIKGNGSRFANIPVDSKFPFNSYQKLVLLEESDSNYKSEKATFERDVKTRIQEAAKYISEEDNTVYTIMFIPSEGVFSFISGNTSLIDDAFKQRVIIAGPSTLVSIIQSVDQYMQMFDDINKFDKKVEMLRKTIKYLNNYDEVIIKFFESFDRLVSVKSEINVKEKSLVNQYRKLLSELDISDEE